MKTFREAVESRDLDAVEALLADDIVFRSPVVHTPYPGKAITAAILRHVIEVFEDFHYVRELSDGPNHALIFQAKVDGLDITGCDFLAMNEEGKIADFMVMTRPFKATQALMAHMGARFDQIKADALSAMAIGRSGEG